MEISDEGDDEVNMETAENMNAAAFQRRVEGDRRWLRVSSSCLINVVLYSEIKVNNSDNHSADEGNDQTGRTWEVQEEDSY